MSEAQANLEIFLSVAVLGVSLILAAVAVLAYTRLRNPRALLIALGLAVFAAKGGYLSWAAWASRGSETWIVLVAGLDLLILTLLYLAIRTR